MHITDIQREDKRKYEELIGQLGEGAALEVVNNDRRHRVAYCVLREEEREGIEELEEWKREFQEEEEEQDRLREEDE